MRETSLIAALLFMTGILAWSAQAEEDEGGIEIEPGIKTVVFFYNSAEGVRLSVESGWSLGGELILWFEQGFGIGAEIEYYAMSETLHPLPGVEVAADYSQMPICINGYYRFKWGDDLVPFFGGGIAFVRSSASTSTSAFGNTIDFDFSDTFIGMTVFAGLQYYGFYVEAQWLQVDADLGINPGILAAGGHSEASGLSVWVGWRF